MPVGNTPKRIRDVILLIEICALDNDLSPEKYTINRPIILPHIKELSDRSKEFSVGAFFIITLAKANENVPPKTAIWPMKKLSLIVKLYKLLRPTNKIIPNNPEKIPKIILKLNDRSLSKI